LLTSRDRGTDRRQELRRAWEVRLLPRSVASFYLRALRTASRANDRLTTESAPRPRELAKLLEVARGREEVVQVGTGTVWTAIALVLSDERRRVTSFDPLGAVERERYLSLIASSVRQRVDFRDPAEITHSLDAPVDLVVVDGSPDRRESVGAFWAAESIVNPGGLVVFPRYSDPNYRGVGEAISELGLKGFAESGMFFWRKPVTPVPVRAIVSKPRFWRRLVLPVGLGAGLALGLAAGIAAPWSNNDDAKTVVSMSTHVQTHTVHRVRTVRSVGGRSQAGSKRRAGATPSRQKPRNRSRARSVQRFAGRGSKSLGTVKASGPTLLKWTTRGTSFTIVSDALRLNSPGHSGSTIISRGPYRHFRVRTKGRWTLKLQRR
jgi:hypothetical protein